MNNVDVNSAVARPTSSVVSRRAATSQNTAPVRACTAAPTTSAADPARRWRCAPARPVVPVSATIDGEATAGVGPHQEASGSRLRLDPRMVGRRDEQRDPHLPGRPGRSAGYGVILTGITIPA